MTTLECKQRKASFKELASTIQKNDNLRCIRLEHIEIEGNDDDLLGLSKALRGHPSLEELSMSFVTTAGEVENLDQAISMVFVSVPNIRTVRLEGVDVTTSCLVAAGYCSTLRELLLPNSGLTDSDAATIAATIAQNTAIEVLDLSGNDLSDLGVNTLTKAMEKNMNLKVVRLEGNSNISGTNKMIVEDKLDKRAVAKAA